MPRISDLPEATTLLDSDELVIARAGDSYKVKAPALGSLEINVKSKTYAGGAKGDGVTDDTAAIQAAITAAYVTSTAGVGTKVFFPPGQYKITAPLVLTAGSGFSNAGSITLEGANRDGTCIQQENDNTKIFTVSGGTYNQTVTIRDLRLQWKNQQTTSHTQSYAIDWPSSPGTYVSWTIERCWINRAYVAMGYAGASGSPSSWNLLVHDTWITSTAQTAVKLSAPTPVGQPSCRFDHLYIANTGVGHPTNAALAPAGPAFLLTGAGVNMTDIDLEGWHNCAVNFSGTSQALVVDTFYVEWHKFNDNDVLFTTGPALFYLAGDADIRGVFASGDVEEGVPTASMFWIDAGASLRLGPVATAFNIVSGSLFGVRASAGTKLHWANDWRVQSGAITLLDSGLGFPDALVGGQRDLTYSATINTDASVASDHFVITATNNTAFTIANPTNLRHGDVLTYTIRNTSGGALGALTFGSVFKAGTWTQPANTFSRSITFRYNGTNLVEIGRTPVDVPN